MADPDPLRRRRLLRILPGVLILGIWIFGFGSLDQYNITWDDALGDFFYGERYLSFFTSGDARYLDGSIDPYPADRRPDLSASPFRGRPWEYYPVANVLAAASSAVLSGTLGLLDPFDGFHAVNLFYAALLVWALCAFAGRRFGVVTAVASVGFLFGAPRVTAHMMANIKDFPLMVTFTLTALLFFHAFESGSARGLWLTGGLLGLALATKANAVFFPALPALTLLLGGVPEPWRERRRSLIGILLGAGVLSLVVMVAVWPYLWQNPVAGVAEHLRFLLTRKAATSASSVAPFFEALLFTTPPAFLLAVGIGAAYSLGPLRRRDRTLIFLWVWIAVILGRYLLPGTVNYDGVRHFLEVFPALAVVAGFGVTRAAADLVAHTPLRAGRALVARATIAALFVLPGAWQVLATHPFQLAYWNGLVGGYAGARDSNQPQAADYWGLSYRQGMRWLNQNAEPDSFLAVPIVEHAVRLVAPERLRGDIGLLPITTPFSPHIEPERLRRTLELSLERPVYVMFVERRDWMNVLMADCLERLDPVAEWSLDGAPVLQIYRYRPPIDPRRQP